MPSAASLTAVSAPTERGVDTMKHLHASSRTVRHHDVILRVDDGGVGSLLAGTVAVNGLTYETREDWNARPPRAKAASLSTPVEYIVIQHTVDEPCFSPKICAERTRFIQDLHMDVNEWNDIGYNFLVGGDGTALEGRGWDSVGAFLRGWNKKAIGVVLIGTFVKVQPTDEQMAALLELIEQGVVLGKVRADYKVVAACELADTESPGAAALAELKKFDHWWDTGADHCK